jgi:Tol biopolymer transport system component
MTGMRTISTRIILVVVLSCGLLSTVAARGEAPGRVLFGHWRGRTWDLAVADPSTSEVSHLTDTRKHEMSAVFSPDGTKVAFTRPGPDNYDLFVMKRRGTRSRRLTGGETGDTLAAWSPDGARIAYSAFRLGMSRVRGEGIWIVDVSTGRKRRLSHGANDQGAQWSPGGGRVLFYGWRGGDYELMLAHLPGGRVQRLTDNGRSDLFPRWAANGSSVVYTGTAKSGARHLFRLTLADGSRTRLTPQKTDDQAGIVSPDGTRIAFLRCAGTTCALWVMHSDGSHRKELFGGGVENGPPVWSPGGNRLAFSHLNANGRYDISVVDVDSGEVSGLTKLRGDESLTDWR